MSETSVQKKNLLRKFLPTKDVITNEDVIEIQKERASFKDFAVTW